MANINTGVINPSYVTHPTLAAPRRIKIDGIPWSDCNAVVAMVEYRDGSAQLVIDGGTDFEHFCKVHQLLVLLVKEFDRRLGLHAQTIPGDR